MKSSSVGIIKILNLIAAVILILLCNSVYAVRDDDLFKLILMAVLVLIILFSWSGDGKSWIYNIEPFLFLAYFIIIVVFLLTSTDYRMSLIINMMMIFPLVYFTVRRSADIGTLDNLVWCFVQIASLLAAFSLVIWVFGSLLHIIQPTGIWSVYWGKQTTSVNSYFNLQFETQTHTIGDTEIIRNTGIFVEAPFAAYIYTSAALLNIFYLKMRLNNIRSIVLLVALMSTTSTTGVLAAILIVSAVFFGIQSDSVRVRTVKVILLFFYLVLVLYGIYLILTNKMSTHSGIVRLDRIRMEWKAFQSSPLFGCGFISYSLGSSNSFFSLLADGGILLWSIYYVPIIVCIIIGIRKNGMHWPYLIFALSFSLTVIEYSAVTFFFLSIMLNCTMASEQDNK